MRTYDITWVAIIYKDDIYKYIDGDIKLESDKELSMNELDKLAREIIKGNIYDKYNTERIFKLYITEVN